MTIQASSHLYVSSINKLHFCLFALFATIAGCHSETGPVTEPSASKAKGSSTFATAENTSTKTAYNTPQLAEIEPQPAATSLKPTGKPAAKPTNRSAAMALDAATTSSSASTHDSTSPLEGAPEDETQKLTAISPPSSQAALPRANSADSKVTENTGPAKAVSATSVPAKTSSSTTETASTATTISVPTSPAPSQSETKKASSNQTALVKTEVALTETTKSGVDKTDASIDKGPKKADASDEFFQKGLIPEIRITLTDKEEAQLRRDLRRYVDITFTENGTTTYKKAKMKLKGAAGSFRDLNDRPALTITTKAKGEKFHGLEKFHLNNSVQDESYLNELIASELCQDAGLPAARTSHARVWLNNRDLGFYVLKEGMDERFIKRHFKNAKGNFYEGGFCADIDAALEKEFGDGPDDRSDLKEIIEACREGDQTKRWQRIDEKVDIKDFINFAAMELMMCHWDGYCNNRNNYRLYITADDKKVHFLPHGMDQMFGDINFPVFNIPGPMVANVVLQNPAVQARYRQRVRELLPFFAPEKLNARIDAAHARIRPALAAIHEDRARQFDARVTDYKNRVGGRLQAIKNQFPPEPIAFNNEGWALTEDWAAKPQGDAKLEFLETEGKKVLSFSPGPSNQIQASFRTKVRLARGGYRFEGKVKTNGVVSPAEDKTSGAGVRLSGGTRTNHATGTTDWQPVTHEFEVGQDLQEVELVAELRSTAGSAQFEQNSLRVYKVK